MSSDNTKGKENENPSEKNNISDSNLNNKTNIQDSDQTNNPNKSSIKTTSNNDMSQKTQMGSMILKDGASIMGTDISTNSAVHQSEINMKEDNSKLDLEKETERVAVVSNNNPNVTGNVGEDPNRLTQIYDINNNPIKELGFNEKIPLPLDIIPSEVKLKVLPRGFKIFCKSLGENTGEAETYTFHKFEYARSFDRTVTNVYMEAVPGFVMVCGDFKDVNYPGN